MATEYQIKSQEALVKQCQHAFNKQVKDMEHLTDPDSPEALEAMTVLDVLRRTLLQQEEKLEEMKNGNK